MVTQIENPQLSFNSIVDHHRENRVIRMEVWKPDFQFYSRSSDDMILSNRYLSFTMSATQITLNMKTINYHYDVAIKRDHALLTVIYKGTKYTFKYNNHINSLPYASSYLTLLYHVLYSFLDYIFQFLEFTKSRIEEKGCAAYFNIFHNSILVVPTCPEDYRKKTCAFRLL